MTPTSRVLVTTPDLYEFVTADPLSVADTRYPRSAGYALRIVRGFDGPHGFVTGAVAR